MSLKRYLTVREPFGRDGINCSVIGFNGSWRVICSSGRASNLSGTNGARFATDHIKLGFYARLTEKELDTIEKIIDAESKAKRVRFAIDNETTEAEGLGCVVFYKIAALNSPTVI